MDRQINTAKAPTRTAFWTNPARLGALLAFFGVAFGAFGAHSLEGTLSPDRLATFETAVRYQLFHGLGLLALGALPRRAQRAAPWLFVGSLIFSGSLYVLVLTDTPVLGAVAPVGGVLQLIGWAMLFFNLGRGDSR